MPLQNPRLSEIWTERDQLTEELEQLGILGLLLRPKKSATIKTRLEDLRTEEKKIFEDFFQTK